MKVINKSTLHVVHSCMIRLDLTEKKGDTEKLLLPGAFAGDYTFDKIKKTSGKAFQAERVGFEPTVPCGTRALQARALGQTTLPLQKYADSTIELVL